MLNDKELNGEETLSAPAVDQRLGVPLAPSEEPAPAAPIEPIVTEHTSVENPTLDTETVTIAENTDVGDVDVEEPIIDKEKELERTEEGYQQKNFAFLRRQNEELERKLASYETKQREAVKPEPEPDIDDEDIISGKQYKQQRKDAAALRFEMEQMQFRNTMTTRYDDYNQVMTEKNIAKFMEQEPQTAASMANSTDWKSSIEGMYGLIKKSGIAAPKKTETFTKQKKKAEANLSKPRSASTLSKQLSDSAIGAASNFMSADAEEARKKALWQQTLDEANSF